MDTSSTQPPKTLNGWLGHLLTLVLAGTAGGVGYGTVEARVGNLESRVDNIENQVLREVRDLKDGLTDLRVQMSEVGRDVVWLKEKSK
tara:strand:+ start:904 stop:1167 length:264 start_codon:yes stop_codon:yes gene_type:complete